MVNEPKTKTIQIRIAPEDYQAVQIVAYMAGMTVSKYVRTLINSTVNAFHVQEQQGRVKREDFKTLIDD